MLTCINCSIPYSKNSLLTDSKQHLCNNCSTIETLINKFVVSTHILYTADLQKKFLDICPVFDGEQLIFANPSLMNSSGYNEDIIIMELTEKLGLKNTQYSNNESISNVSNFIMGYLLDDIKDLISENAKGYLLAFLNLLEYNSYLTMTLINWLNTGEEVFQTKEIADNFSRIIIQSLALKKTYRGPFNSIYKEWENVLAFDKQALQYGIEVINYYSKGIPISLKPVNPDKFGKLISTVRALFYILHIRDTAFDSILAEKKLIIDDEGYIKVKQKIDHNSFSDSYVENLLNRKTSNIPESISSQFDQVCKKYLGLKLNDIPKIGELLTATYVNSDDFLIGSISYFKLLFMELLNIKDDTAERLIEMFLNHTDSFNFAVSTADRDFRPLRKCLIVIKDDIIACPINLLCYASMALYMDIIDNSLPESQFKREAFKITSCLHEQFEEDVANLLGQNFKNAIIKHNIPKEKGIPFSNKNEYVTLSGQIDILMLVDGKIFVIECKNNPFKYSAKAIGNELNKFRRVNKGSYQYKLKNKINDVYHNWDSILNFLGVSDPESIEKHEPFGLFVIDSFSAVLLEKDLVSPVVSFSDLCGYIKKTLKSD
ncbi:hypothetical protein A6E25_08100 [Bacillus cereus]|nr:hypothetical protein A6E25_08100 [Bacillus cereus]